MLFVKSFDDINLRGSEVVGLGPYAMESLKPEVAVRPTPFFGDKMDLSKCPKVKPRRAYDKNFTGYMESDMDYFEKNRFACVWLLNQVVQFQKKSGRKK